MSSANKCKVLEKRARKYDSWRMSWSEFQRKVSSGHAAFFSSRGMISGQGHIDWAKGKEFKHTENL